MHVAIYVRPGAAKESVGGTFDDALVVRVTDPPAKGRATQAAVRAVAASLGVPRHAVRLVRGSTSRQKLLEIDVDEADAPALGRRLRALMAGPQDLDATLGT